MRITKPWNAVPRRGEILREIATAADSRRDGALPLDIPGAREAFRDDLDLLGALILRWHTRLTVALERERAVEPTNLAASVSRAWAATAIELPGIRAIIDAHRENPRDDAMAAALAKAETTEHIALAAAAGLATRDRAAAVRVGARIERAGREILVARARPAAAASEPTGSASPTGSGIFVARLKAALSAA